MIDALAADKRQGDEQANNAYVLAASTANQMEKSEKEWQAKGVRPILYNQKSNRRLLHKTLEKWAAIHRDGLTGKEGIVKRYAKYPPMKPYDETVGQVIWALSEESGHIASTFSKISDPLPPIEWLEVFESEGFLNLANYYNSTNNGPPLVDRGFRSVCPESLNPITRNIAIWLAQHLDKKELLDWVIRSGSCIHPEFRDFTRRQLSKITLPMPLKVIWQTINSESYFSACSCVTS